MVVYVAFNPSPWEARWGTSEFKASLYYNKFQDSQSCAERPCLQKKRETNRCSKGGETCSGVLRPAVYVCDPRTWEAQAGELWVQGQPWRYSDVTTVHIANLYIYITYLYN